MNKHFEDTRYYLKRASEAATKGVKEELEPVEERFRKMTGREEEPDPGRVERIRGELEEIQGRAEGDAKEALVEARSKLRQYREQRA